MGTLKNILKITKSKYSAPVEASRRKPFSAFAHGSAFRINFEK